MIYETPVIDGVLAWALAAVLCYAFLRRSIINFGDPIVFINVTIPFSAALLSVLCASALVNYDKLFFFFLVLLGYLIGARAAAQFFSREFLRSGLRDTLMRFGRVEICVLLSVTTLITIILAVFAIQGGAQGDARQDFAKAFRPLVVIQSGLFILSLVALLSPKLTRLFVAVWLTLLIVPSVAFSGKSLLLPVFYWFGLSYFVRSKRAGVATVLSLLTLVFIGVAIMGLLAYGISGVNGVAGLIVERLWLSGDTYIYAYQMDALSVVRSEYAPSFISYLFHPLTSLVGIRGYERPLGSMIMSAVKGYDVITGPNPHLPVLLDFFFPGRTVLSFLMSFLFGLFVMLIRAGGQRMARSRGRYLALGGISMAIFCPATGFIDTSQVLILAVSIVAVCAIGSVFEILAHRSSLPVSTSTGYG